MLILLVHQLSNNNPEPQQFQYVQYRTRGKAHLSGRFLYASTLRLWSSGGRKLQLCVFADWSVIHCWTRGELCHPSEPHPEGRLCHLPGSEALELLTWLFPCQQYTFAWEFFHSSHIHPELPQHPMCPFTVNVPLTVIYMLVKSVTLLMCCYIQITLTKRFTQLILK